MPIDRNLPPQQAFTPDQLALMKQAFEEVWTVYSGSIVAGQQDARDVIAVAIIKEATKGESNLSALVEAGKKALGVPS